MSSSKDGELTDVALDVLPVSVEAKDVQEDVQVSGWTTQFHERFLRLSSPVNMWIFFTFCNFLNYIDRGAFAGSLGAIGNQFDLNNTQEGFLGGGFQPSRLFLLILSSPVLVSFVHDGLHGLCTSIWTPVAQVSTCCAHVHRSSHLVRRYAWYRYVQVESRLY